MLKSKKLNSRYAVLVKEDGTYYALKDIKTQEQFLLNKRAIFKTSTGQILCNGQKLIVQNEDGQLLINGDKIIDNMTIQNIDDDANIDELLGLDFNEEQDDTVKDNFDDEQDIDFKDNINDLYEDMSVKNTCYINGKRYDLPKGSISIINNEVYVGNKKCSAINNSLLQTEKKRIVKESDTELCENTFIYKGHKLPIVPGHDFILESDVIETKSALYCAGYQLVNGSWKKTLKAKLIQFKAWQKSLID